jgi:lipopolysaccharide/colanic/teichoic acid biosynthesis glycosyltransferase
MTATIPASRSLSRTKRLFDLVAGGVLLVGLSPVLLIVAVLVRAKLGSPVIYRQVRPGLHGRPFTIFKFRTMVDTTDDTGKLLPSVQRTPPFGQRLRAMSLDELPELWNVLKGDMSLVGPRPLMMAYLPRYNAEQARRHEVRPGITGLAQVSGRNAISWEQKFALDVEYVNRQSIKLDLEILARTAGAVMARTGIRYGESIDMPEFLGNDVPAPPAPAPGPTTIPSPQR